MANETQSNKAIAPAIGISAAILAFLFWLIYFKTPGKAEGDWVLKLPTIFAGLNAVSACCLGVGIVAIKRGLKRIHIGMMISATLSSALFLVCYIIYHHYHGDTKFLAEWLIRPIYFFILIRNFDFLILIMINFKILFSISYTIVFIGKVIKIFIFI